MNGILEKMRQLARQKEQELARMTAQLEEVKAYLARDSAFDGSDLPGEATVMGFLGCSEEEIGLLMSAASIDTEPKVPVRRGRLRYWENGQWHTTQVMELDPEHEAYYQFDLYGIFKIVNGTRFYSLTENGWERDGEAMRRYYDVQYGYGKISYELVEETPVPEKRCPKCGAVVEADYLFCSKCGAGLKERYCSHCQKQLPEDALFCPYCGRKQ